MSFIGLIGPIGPILAFITKSNIIDRRERPEGKADGAQEPECTCGT
jgi:hypothetical protein